MSGPPPPPPPGPPPPPPPGASRPGAWRKTYRPPDATESLLADARAVFGEDLPTWQLKGCVEGRSDCGYVGIANEGATCFLNSLLQGLYMTAPFRAQVHARPYSEEADGPRDNCIPWQIQLLFAALQQRTCKAISAVPLAHSFGWTSAEMFQQADVQELLHVLFGALDATFPASGSPSPTALFRGATVSYIKCSKCGAARDREEEVCDLSMLVQGAANVYDSLGLYLTPERIDGVNCPACDADQPSDKGTRITALPQVLTLHLQRFVFSFEYMRAVKLNDRYEFPQYLVLDAYVNVDAPPTEAPPLDYVPGDDPSQWPDGLFELYMVLVHAGTGSGGHYYAYGLSPDGTDWIHFNDSDVAASTWENVTRTYGGSDAGGASSSKAANAYLLLYRAMDRENPTAHHRAFSADDLDPTVAALVAEQEAEYAALLDAFAERQRQISLNVVHNGTTAVIRVDKGSAVSDAVAAAVAAHGLDDDAASTSVFRRFDPNAYILGEAFEAAASMESLDFFTNMYVVLEAVGEAAVPVDVREAFCIPIFQVAPSGAELTPVEFVIEDDDDAAVAMTVGGLCDAVADATGISRDSLALFRVVKGAAVPLGDDEGDDGGASKSLIGKHRFMSGTAVFAEDTSAGGGAVVEWFERERATITVFYSLLDSDEADQAIVVDSRQSVLEFKDELAARLGVASAEQFVLTKALQGAEFKERSESLRLAGFYTNCKVWCQAGTARQPGQMDVVFYHYTPNDDDFVTDRARLNALSFRHLCKMVVYAEVQTLGDVKEALCADLGERGYTWTPSCLTFHERVGTKAATVLRRNHEPFLANLPSSYAGRDTVDIAVRDGAGESLLFGENDILIEVRELRPMQRTLGACVPIGVDRTMTKGDLGELLGARWADGAAVETAKVVQPLTGIENAFTLKWEVDDGILISDSPWYLRDGDVIVFRVAAAAEEAAARTDASATAAVPPPQQAIHIAHSS